MFPHGLRSFVFALALCALGLPAGEAAACERHAAPEGASPATRTATAAEPSGDAAEEGGEEKLTARCTCESKADCTCKKGTCKCKKCKGGHHRQVVEKLSEERDAKVTPSEASREARGGVFL